jgi:hypothetical protein
VSGFEVVLLVASILITVLSVVGLAWIGLVVLSRRQAARLREEWAAAGLAIHKGPDLANYRGHAGDLLAVRGNGLIALTDDDVRIVRFWPRQEFVIPLDAITHLDTPRVWNASYRAGAPLLAIYYQREDEQTGVGVFLRDRDAWQHTIAHAAGVQLNESQHESR